MPLDLLAFLRKAEAEGFVDSGHLRAILIDDDPARLCDRLLAGASALSPKAWVATPASSRDARHKFDDAAPPLRLAFVGSAGTGKTTLAGAVAKALRLPVSPERVREGIRALGLPSPRELTVEQQATLAEWVAEERLRFESTTEAFVADRSSVDSVAYWLLVVSRALRQPDRGQVLLARCRQHAARYTDIMVLPHGYPAEIREDGYRTTDPVYQYGMQTMLRGLLDEWGIAWREVPMAPLEERVVWVLDCLGARTSSGQA